MTPGVPNPILCDTVTVFVSSGTVPLKKKRNRTANRVLRETQVHQIAGISAENRRRDLPTMQHSCLPVNQKLHFSSAMDVIVPVFAASRFVPQLTSG